MSAADSSSLDLVMERKNLQDKLTGLRRSIDGGIDVMEKSKEGRSLRRKEFVLKVMKMVLANLEALDNEVMSEMKSEAFDLVRACSKSEAELDQLSSAISSSQDDASQLLTDIRLLDRQVDCLGIETFVQSLNLSVDSEIFDSASVMETMRDAVFLKTPSVSPRSFTLVIPEIGSSVFFCNQKLEVHVNQEGLTFTPFILKRLMFSVGFTDLENCSLWTKLENKTGEIRANGKIFTFWMKKRSQMNCKLSVKFLSSNISSSPQILEAVDATQLAPLPAASQAVQKLVRDLSLDSSAGHDPPQKIPRLEEGYFQSPLTQAASSSAMECEEGKGHRPDREDGNEEDLLPTPPSEATGMIWDKSAIQPGEDCNATVAFELDDGEEMEEEMAEEMATSTPPTDQDNLTPATATSLWKTLPSQPAATRFDFLQDLEEVGSFGALIVDERRRRPDMALINPNDVAYIPLQHCFLVSEPALYRVGIYEAETFTFVRWLTHPENPDGSFNMPMSLLSLRNGDVLVLEKDRIWILDSALRGWQYKYGSFSGLAEGGAGEVFTLAHLREGGVNSIQKLVVGPERNYRFDGQIKLDVIETFSNREHAKPRFITYSNQKLFITDTGINKFYVVDLVTGSQKAFGCFGTNEGQFRKPAGILPDDNGHLLIADRSNRRLLVYSENGEFIKVAKKETLSNNKLVLVQSVRRFRNFLILVQMARREKPISGRVVCYKLKGETEG